MNAIAPERLEEAAKRLTTKEVKLLAQAMNTLEQADRRKKFQNLFPDEGPFRRELYPVHMEFFKAGAQYRERLLMAANRFGKCSTVNSLIETPEGEISVGEIVKRGKPFEVIAWDGRKKVIAQASAPFRKETKEPCVRIEMRNGQWFEAALGHRILTCEGWLHVGDYVQLSRRRAGLPDDLLLSSWGYGQSIRGEDGPRSTQTPLSFQADYPANPHYGDGQPRGCAAFGLAPTPLPDDVLEHSPASSRWDDLAGTHTNILCAGSARPSILYAFHQSADLSAEFAHLAYGTSVQLLSDQRQERRRLPLALTDLLRSASVDVLDRTAAPSYSQGAKECCYANSSSPEHISSHQEFPQSVDGAFPVLSKIELGCRPLHVPLGSDICAVYFIGCHEVYDFEVEKFRNYVGSGLIHHNTVAAGVEVSAHLTGRYPHWWEGKRFDHPIDAWAAGDTNETTRDIIQKTLLGETTWVGGRKCHDGVGIIPHDCHGAVRWKTGVTDLVDYIDIKHESGGWSRLGFKSYDQGRRVFQGTARHLVWLDEECPMDVYGECLIRTATTQGIILLTFTPLLGMSELVRSFLQPDTGVTANA